MANYVKQVANVFFDAEDGVFRAFVEFHPEDFSSDGITIPVEFPGSDTFTFVEIREKAFQTAAELMSKLP